MERQLYEWHLGDKGWLVRCREHILLQGSWILWSLPTRENMASQENKTCKNHCLIDDKTYWDNKGMMLWQWWIAKNLHQHHNGDSRIKFFQRGCCHVHTHQKFASCHFYLKKKKNNTSPKFQPHLGHYNIKKKPWTSHKPWWMSDSDSYGIASAASWSLMIPRDIFCS